MPHTPVKTKLLDELVHLVVKHCNKNVKIWKGAFNNAPDERNGLKFYTDDTSFYVVAPSNNACSIRILGTTSNDHISYEVMPDSDISGLTPVIID